MPTVEMYLIESLDPIHIGTGEFRLGRVDNTIVREPGTNLPKIPGSSIAGVTRAYTAMKHEDKYLRQRGGKLESCAGKGGADGADHCGSHDCPVCTTYGFSKKKRSFQGLAQFSDARLLFFPVYSVAGPVWVTCPESLQDAGCTGADWDTWDQKLDGDNAPSLVVLGSVSLPDPLNLGWLYLPRHEEALSAAEWTLKVGENSKKLSEIPYLKAAAERLILVSNAVFSVLVEDQLEVRTSVSISPETGAAAEGALFTSEAIPRASFLFFHVTCLNPKLFRVPVDGDPPFKAVLRDTREAETNDILRDVKTGLGLMETLGVGGINTRGLGRARVIGL